MMGLYGTVRYDTKNECYCRQITCDSMFLTALISSLFHTPINPGTPEGAKLFQAGCAPLDVEGRFSVKVENTKHVIKLRKRRETGGYNGTACFFRRWRMIGMITRSLDCLFEVGDDEVKCSITIKMKLAEGGYVELGGLSSCQKRVSSCFESNRSCFCAHGSGCTGIKKRMRGANNKCGCRPTERLMVKISKKCLKVIAKI
eukprot:scaffold4645_cov50-Attheya_sp.AAC.3